MSAPVVHKHSPAYSAVPYPGQVPSLPQQQQPQSPQSPNQQQQQQPQSPNPQQQQQQPQSIYQQPQSPNNQSQQQQETKATSSPAKPFFTKEQIEQYNRDGFIQLKWHQVWSPTERDAIVGAVNDMDHWPEKAHHWMIYLEKNLKDPNGPKIRSRIENFLQYSPTLDHLFNGDRILQMVSELFKEKAVLYKEKINYKLPGGDGFKPHQDHAAGWWMYGQTLHISALVSIDAASLANGGLELVRGRHKDGLLGDPWKEVPDNLVKEMKWEGCDTEPGDVVFFDSFVPHRSGPNMTDGRRRVAYLTYGKASEGDLRERYYSDKRKSYPPDIEREKGKVYEYKI